MTTDYPSRWYADAENLALRKALAHVASEAEIANRGLRAEVKAFSSQVKDLVAAVKTVEEEHEAAEADINARIREFGGYDALRTEVLLERIFDTVEEMVTADPPVTRVTPAETISGQPLGPNEDGKWTVRLPLTQIGVEKQCPIHGGYIESPILSRADYDRIKAHMGENTCPACHPGNGGAS